MIKINNNKTINIIISVALILFLFIILSIVGDYNDTHYTMKGTVIETNLDKIIIEDITGNL